MSKHTPGPWFTDGQDVFAHSGVSVVAPCLSKEEATANNHLIAEAPAMYEVLKDAYDALFTDPRADVSKVLVPRIAAILCKLEGRS